ncbi:MAG: class I SAM-dependent methyltransferase [Nostoc sp. C3-bin3]|nr:class I SAM-dependent methyltransferase [Nostoc sp. C3-bin3]
MQNIINFHQDFNRFVEDSCCILPQMQLPISPLQYVLREKLVNQDGLWLEFGVGSGHTLNLICEYRLQGTVYGFDSFEGLPLDWRTEFPKGAFKQPELPRVKSNAALIKGLFEDTIPQFIAAQCNSYISLLHIDCDLYSSTKTIFSYLGEKLIEGSIIVFDELIGYPGFESHELKAFYEFALASKKKFQWIGINGTQETQELFEYAQYGSMGEPWFTQNVPLKERVAVRVLS